MRHGACYRTAPRSQRLAVVQASAARASPERYARTNDLLSRPEASFSNATVQASRGGLDVLQFSGLRALAQHEL
jgi:hypothetical protein